MASYKVMVGKKYDVIANSADEARDKYFGYLAGEDCSCGVEVCDCVEFNEIDTLVIGGDE
jgi:hypothetical protein